MVPHVLALEDMHGPTYKPRLAPSMHHDGGTRIVDIFQFLPIAVSDAQTEAGHHLNSCHNLPTDTGISRPSARLPKFAQAFPRLTGALWLQWQRRSSGRRRRTKKRSLLGSGSG